MVSEVLTVGSCLNGGPSHCRNSCGQHLGVRRTEESTMATRKLMNSGRHNVAYCVSRGSGVSTFPARRLSFGANTRSCHPEWGWAFWAHPARTWAEGPREFAPPGAPQITARVLRPDTPTRPHHSPRSEGLECVQLAAAFPPASKLAGTPSRELARAFP